MSVAYLFSDLLVLLLTLAGKAFTTSFPVDDQLNCVMLSKFYDQVLDSYEIGGDWKKAS